MREGVAGFQMVEVLVVLLELGVALMLTFLGLFDLRQALGLSPSRIMTPLFMRGVGEELLVGNRRRVTTGLLARGRRSSESPESKQSTIEISARGMNQRGG